ncbi:uncharacterized protein LOC129204954 [Grus americana]|uniref:uncharacterized protein LOC129204954 n=1 Tax=Grus americana TaxID=9117 RepID=UPI002407D01A|nr:uncharacterized protein LOC129204954 [Grus americana]
MAAQKAGDICDCAPGWAEEINKLHDFLEVYGSRPLPLRQDWARHHWFHLQSVIDRMTVVQRKAKVKKGKGKAIIGAVLGVCLPAVVEERKWRSCQAEAVVASLQAAITALQEQLQENKRALEEEKRQNLILKEELRNQLLRETDALAEEEVLLEEKGIRQVYPWGDIKGVKEAVKSPPHMCPQVKMEYVYEDNSDNRPQVITKEIPFMVTELAKLRKDFARTVRESETEYVWRVSLSGADGVFLSEKEAEGYWGPGVFLTTGDHQAPWSLTQRVAYWAGGLNSVGRGDPLAITASVDQLVESVQKAACLQMMYDRELKPNLSSPMLLPVDPERMMPLIRGLPDSLKPIGIQLQGRIQNTPSEERIMAALEGMVTPEHQRPGRKAWTWGEIAQELINYGRKYGPVSRSYQKVETRAVQTSEQGSGRLPFSGRSPDLTGKEKPLTQQGLWQLGLKKGVPQDLMDGLPTKKLELLVQRWSGQGTTPRPSLNTLPIVNMGKEQEGDERMAGN